MSVSDMTLEQNQIENLESMLSIYGRYEMDVKRRVDASNSVSDSLPPSIFDRTQCSIGFDDVIKFTFKCIMSSHYAESVQLVEVMKRYTE